MKIPMAPSPKEIVPATTNKPLLNLLELLSLKYLSLTNFPSNLESFYSPDNYKLVICLGVGVLELCQF